MKQPKPDRLVVMEGIPITVHSANHENSRGRNGWTKDEHKQGRRMDKEDEGVKEMKER